MAQEVISSAILIIAAIIASLAVINAMYPSLFAATGSVASVSDTANNRLLTGVKIVMASADGTGTLHVWVKNDGSVKVPGNRIAYTDVYFGERGHMAKASADTSGALQWTYALDDLNGDGDWGPGETVAINITDVSETSFTPGNHDVRLVLYNSVSVGDTVSL